MTDNAALRGSWSRRPALVLLALLVVGGSWHGTTASVPGSGRLIAAHPAESERWLFDFIAIERQVAAYSQTEESAPPEAAELLEELEVATDHLPAGLGEAELARLAFLCRVSFPGAIGQRWAELLPAMYRYRQAREEQAQERADARQALARDKQLQAAIFGPEWAKRLFRRENALKHYLLERQRLLRDDSLGTAERRQALEQLRATLGEGP